jgi:hypothetical protein
MTQIAGSTTFRGRGHPIASLRQGAVVSECLGYRTGRYRFDRCSFIHRTWLRQDPVAVLCHRWSGALSFAWSFAWSFTWSFAWSFTWSFARGGGRRQASVMHTFVSRNLQWRKRRRERRRRAARRRRGIVIERRGIHCRHCWSRAFASGVKVIDDR